MTNRLDIDAATVKREPDEPRATPAEGAKWIELCVAVPLLGLVDIEVEAEIAWTRDAEGEIDWKVGDIAIPWRSAGERFSAARPVDEHRAWFRRLIVEEIEYRHKAFIDEWIAGEVWDV